MAAASIDTEDRGIELEIFGPEQNKFSGATFMLKDLEGRFIYKVLPRYSYKEVAFYCASHNMPMQPNTNKVDDSFRTLPLQDVSFLAENDLIPRFKGLVNVLETHDDDKIRWFEVPPNTTATAKAIKLEKVDYGYKKPAVVDIKLGSHNAIDNSHIGNLTPQQRMQCVQRWRTLKRQQQTPQGSIVTKRLLKLHANDLGLGEPFSEMNLNTLHAILKSWRQQQVAFETTEHALGLRISSIYIPTDEPIKIESTAAKRLSVEETKELLERVFKGRPSVCRAVLKCLDSVKSWILMQRNFSIVASSLLVVFDLANEDLCNAKWIDFTHVHNNDTAQAHDAKGNFSNNNNSTANGADASAVATGSTSIPGTSKMLQGINLLLDTLGSFVAQNNK